MIKSSVRTIDLERKNIPVRGCLLGSDTGRKGDKYLLDIKTVSQYTKYGIFGLFVISNAVRNLRSLAFARDDKRTFWLLRHSLINGVIRTHVK
jgi:hypothetical protein